MGKSDVPLVALDTNVYISAALLPKSLPGKIIKAWKKKQINVTLSEPILSEILDVLQRPYFAKNLGWRIERLEKHIERLRLNSVIVPGNTSVSVCRDPKDNMIFSCALESGAKYIVSGDSDVLEVKIFQNIPVKSPREFVNEVLRKK